jgi:hypothetical protein
MESWSNPLGILGLLSRKMSVPGLGVWLKWQSAYLARVSPEFNPNNEKKKKKKRSPRTIGPQSPSQRFGYCHEGPASLEDLGSL